MVTANIRALLANCAYVAIGAARINGNNPDDRERVFVFSCVAVLDFVLDCIDEHWRALNDAQEGDNPDAEIKLSCNYERRDDPKGD